MHDKIEHQNSNFNLKLWGQILRETGRHRKLMIMLGVLMIVIAGIDSVLPLLTRFAIDHFIIPKQYGGLTIFAAVNVLAIFIQTLNTWLLIALAGKIETGLNFDLRKKCFRRLQTMEFAYYDKTPTGWIVARLTNDISKLGDIIAWSIVDVVWGFTLMLGMAVIMIILNWKLALLSLAVIPILLYISSKFQITLLRDYRLVRRFNSQLTNSYRENMHGAKTTKTLLREEKNMSEFDDLNGSMFHYSVRAAVKSALFMPMIMVISSLSTGIIIWLGGNSVIAEVIGYGTLVAFISYSVQFFDPIAHIAQKYAEMQNAQAAAERIFSLLDLKPQIVNSVPYSAEWVEKRLEGKIEIERIHFAYQNGKPVFEDFSLQIKAGESIALVGETGTGKTTLVNLICRFYELQKGEILIDGYDYQKVPMEWIHKHLGFVQQTPHLFQGSIRENIRYGRLDATDEEVETAARIVSADEFIISLSGTYDYQVGESGNLLSTGQKQLISFARVVLANPAILILDEATSSIDTETEQLIQKAIHKIMEGRTTIIIAHRLSTIRSVDRIILMHNGKILETGSHKSLMHQKANYYRLYTNQFLQEEGDKILSQV